MRPAHTIVINPEWQTLLKANGLDSVDAIFSRKDGTVIKAGKNTEVRRLDLNGHIVFLKKYLYPTFRLRLSGANRGTFFGISKAHREYDNLGKLRAWGLDAPAPVAYCEERRCRWLWRSALLSEGIPDPVALDVFIRGPRGDLINRLADYTRRMHEHRFVHHDYFWRNILLSGNSLEHFYLIDSHKGRQWRCGGHRNRAKDLATLDAPAPGFFRRTERLRFFLRYLGHDRLTDDDKQFLRLVLQLAAPMRDTQLRRVRKAQ